jgi:hypothetical protein
MGGLAMVVSLHLDEETRLETDTSDNSARSSVRLSDPLLEGVIQRLMSCRDKVLQSRSQRRLDLLGHVGLLSPRITQS